MTQPYFIINIPLSPQYNMLSSSSDPDIALYYIIIIHNNPLRYFFPYPSNLLRHYHIVPATYPVITTLLFQQVTTWLTYHCLSNPLCHYYPFDSATYSVLTILLSQHLTRKSHIVVSALSRDYSLVTQQAVVILSKSCFSNISYYHISIPATHYVHSS